jgi:hypothetical protein
VIEDRDPGAGRSDALRHLFDLAFSGEQRGIGTRAAPLDQRACRDAGAGGELLDLFQAVSVARLAEVEADQHRVGAFTGTLVHQTSRCRVSSVGALI